MTKRISRLLRPGIIWYCVVILLFSVGAFWRGDYLLGAIEAVITVMVFVISRIIFIRRKYALMEYVQEATDSVGVSVHAGSPFPMVVLNLPENEIIWGNPAFYEISGLSDSGRYNTMERIVPGFRTDWIQDGRSEYPGDQTINGRRYRLYGNYVRSAENDTTVKLATIYFADMTEMFNIRDHFLRTRPVVIVVLVDNYEEMTSSLSDSKVSNLDAQLYEVIRSWVGEDEALCRKVERNRYLIITQSEQLSKLQEQKFSLIESVHSVVSPSGISASVSIGIGKDGKSYSENYGFAVLSLEMCLSRGGDQAVMKDKFNFSFFGGKAKEADRQSTVKSRLTANLLSELIATSSRIFVMGHKMADLDCLGAAIGLVSLCRKKEKPIYIVLDRQTVLAENFLKELEANSEYASCFISPEDALIQADGRSLLIVVDTNRTEQVESKELLEAIPRVALFDHHRSAADYIENAVLKHHEPYASSASELVTEVLSYALDVKDIRQIEAQALLAGIALDTKNFTIRTGSRTFEAAAFLRRAGADTVNVKKLFQNDLETTKQRYQIIQSARLYRNEIAIAVYEQSVSRTVASQAADELLTISGIMTSFVLFPVGNQVMICARSIGDCNVQVILEQLGGGGNAATAGAQISDQTIREVLQHLVSAIDEFYEK